MNSIALTSSFAGFDKRLVAESFGRAAAQYDSLARLQQRVGHRLLARVVHESHADILDLGSGTGYFTEQLRGLKPKSRIIGLDISLGMLEFSRLRRGHAAQAWVCADAETLPLRDDCCDLVFSNLAIQWCDALDSLFAEVQRVLRPGGLFVFTTLGQQTLQELRLAWQSVDDYVHVNRFQSREEIIHALPVPFRWQLDTETEVLSYSTLRELTRELKGIGAHNINPGRNPGLTSPHQVRQLIRNYDLLRDESGQLPATWEVHYGTLRKLPRSGT